MAPDEDLEASGVGTRFEGHLHHLVSTPSTNTLALAAVQQGHQTGVWIADEQTAGRGRGGHAWHSPAIVDGYAAGLYVSVLLRPKLPGAEALKLSLAAGLAAQSAIAQVTGARIDLRWPNDLMLAVPRFGERKVGGILTESAMEGGASGALAHAVIGIGINLNRVDFPGELQEAATSLRLALGVPIPRRGLLTALLHSLEVEIELAEREAAGLLTSAEPTLNQRFERGSSWVRELRVHVEEEGGYHGMTAGLDERGLLLVVADDGTLKTVRHGGVRRALQE